MPSVADSRGAVRINKTIDIRLVLEREAGSPMQFFLSTAACGSEVAPLVTKVLSLICLHHSTFVFESEECARVQSPLLSSSSIRYEENKLFDAGYHNQSGIVINTSCLNPVSAAPDTSDQLTDEGWVAFAFSIVAALGLILTVGMGIYVTCKPPEKKIKYDDYL